MFYNKNVVDIRSASITAPVKQSIDINNLFVRKIISFMRTGCKILDIGTGNGFVLKQIYENSNIKSTLTGIDNSKEMVNVARQSLGNVATIFEGNNNNLPFEDNTYDIVTAKNVTRYNSDEIYRVLKKGGYFVFREYGTSKGLVEIANLFKDRLIRSRDVSFYSTRLEKSGFEIVSIEQFEILKRYQNVQEIINITKSFPFISEYSLNDEEAIRRELNGNCEITSDPFILVAKKQKGKVNTMKKVELLFDTIRSPYDIAHIIQIANAIDCVIYTAGKNSIPFNIPKVVSKVRSWNITGDIKEIHYNTFEEAINDLKSKGKYLIGTSGNTNKIFYDLDLPDDKDIVVVFGTETSGLTFAKQEMLDETIKLPMDKSKVDFLTLPVAVSAIAYELYRKYNFE